MAITGATLRGPYLCMALPAICERNHRWIPLTKASDADFFCFLWSAPRTNGWANNRDPGDLSSHRAHYDVTVLMTYHERTKIVSEQNRWHQYLHLSVKDDLQCVLQIRHGFHLQLVPVEGAAKEVRKHFGQEVGNQQRDHDVDVACHLNLGKSWYQVDSIGASAVWCRHSLSFRVTVHWQHFERLRNIISTMKPRYDFVLWCW